MDVLLRNTLIHRVDMCCSSSEPNVILGPLSQTPTDEALIVETLRAITNRRADTQRLSHTVKHLQLTSSAADTCTLQHSPQTMNVFSNTIMCRVLAGKCRSKWLRLNASVKPHVISCNGLQQETLPLHNTTCTQLRPFSRQQSPGC